MMGGTQAISSTQIEAMLAADEQHQYSQNGNTNNSSNSNALLSLPPHLLEELISANDRLSNYLENSTCSNANLVRLTERARIRNEMIALRGEWLRARRDEDLKNQGLATVFNDNVWTLDRTERGNLANAFNTNQKRDTTGDPNIEIISAAEDKESKPARIAYEAVRQAAGYYMQASLVKSTDDERKPVIDVANSSFIPPNMSSLHKKNLDPDAAFDPTKVKQTCATATSILSKFGSQDVMNRLLRDAATTTVITSPNSGNSINASPAMSSQSSNSTTNSSTSSNKISTTTTNISNLFSLPRRRDREEKQQPISSNNNSIMLMAPNNSSM